MSASPSSDAFSFIRSTNLSTEPAIRTAAAFAASFPLGSSIPTQSFLSVTLSPSLRPIEEPSTFIALLSTTNSLSISLRSKAIRADIIFVVLAIGSLCFSFFPKSTSPLSASITIADLAPISLRSMASASKHSNGTNSKSDIKADRIFIKTHPL